MSFEDKLEEEEEKKFDIILVCQMLEEYNLYSNALKLDLYLKAYKELQKFFQILGGFFKFVIEEVESKISILESYRNHPQIGKEYKTLQSFIEYEKKMNLLSSSDRPSGARTLLRLHRAFEFLAFFIHDLNKLQNHDGTASIARKNYIKTLAKYHPWYVRSAASFAMYSLPTREQLILKVFGKDKDNHYFISEMMLKFSQTAEECYNLTQNLYKEHNLLDLP